MVKILAFPSGDRLKEKEDEKVKIIHQIGDTLSLNFTEKEIVLTYNNDNVEKDSFWMMVCCIVFLYGEEKELEVIRDKVLQIAVLSGFPFSSSIPDNEIDFDMDFDLD
tara:strand:+ start:1037 stop:1360 length:324 start_codon:yes stop_codon:yes gene_type:complete